MTPAVLTAFLPSLHQPDGHQCASSQFTVQDDLPFDTTDVVRHEAELRNASGTVVGIVYLSNRNELYIKPNIAMKKADLQAMHIHGALGRFPDIAMQRLNTSIPADLRVKGC